MAHEPIELMLYPNHPKEVRKRAEKEKEDELKTQDTKRVTRVRMPDDTKEIAKILMDWIDQEPRYNLRHFTRIYRSRTSKLKELSGTCPVLKEAYDYAREQIGSNLNDLWRENYNQERYADKWIEFYDTEYHEHRSSIRASVTKGLSQGPTTITITDSSGYRQNGT